MQAFHSFIRSVFFGNYFYGICAIALSIEAALQQYVPLNELNYYIFIFCGTVIFYTKAYVSETTNDFKNKRSVWYVLHKKFVQQSQWILSIIFLISAFILLKDKWDHIFYVTIAQWIVILIFPIVAILYYGINTPLLSKYNLRNTGWLKPFVIGFVWAGCVTVYPVMYYSIATDTIYQITFFGFLLFTKNFMFISVLGIMFDIKDYAADHNRELKTFVVRVGLRKTIFFIMLPLCIMGLGTFMIYAISRNFPLFRILINTIPFILLIIVAYSMYRRKTILYYLAIIDGLMLVKAICGSMGILLIK